MFPQPMHARRLKVRASQTAASRLGSRFARLRAERQKDESEEEASGEESSATNAPQGLSGKGAEDAGADPLVCRVSGGVKSSSTLRARRQGQQQRILDSAAKYALKSAHYSVVDYDR
jgi:hypothetical protein